MARSLLNPLKVPGKNLLRDDRAVAMLEFAFSMPLVLSLGLGGMELANLALAHLRVSQIAMTTADNAGRVRVAVDEADINEVFIGASTVGESLDFEENGRIVLSSLQDNGRTGSAHGQMINWQRCFGDLDVDPAYGVEGDGRTDGSLQSMGQAGRQIQSLPGTAVMFVEVSYEYQPIVGNAILGPTTIRYESAFNVRERDAFGITNTTSLPVNDCQ
jgi:hypothetical protein